MKLHLPKLLLAFFFCLSLSANAQDPHFSQFYNSPMTLNPALTGLMNSEVRMMANYRSQWGSISTPFTTMSASADFSLLHGALSDDFVGLGLVILNDQAGSTQFRNTQVQFSGAYSKSIGRDGNNFISLGGQLGVAQQRINLSKLLFDSQLDGEILNPDINSGENFTNDNSLYLDFSAGIAWSYTPDEYNSFYAGAAMFHLNEPEISFLNDPTELLYTKISAYAGAEIQLTRDLSIIPRGIVLMQGTATEINAGALLRFYMVNSPRAEERISFYLGTMHRWKDAQIFITRFDYGPVGLSISYDMNVSKLGNAINGPGSFEVALVYQSLLTKDRRPGKVRCPQF
ncbi:MAG: PorP/SprF family type IX secretion system membrane protein [Bacteroidota bacterium]